jgi:hypothetical protein
VRSRPQLLLQQHLNVIEVVSFRRQVKRKVSIMHKARLHESGFAQFSSHRDPVGFAAIAAVCVAIATAEVLFGVAQPWPTDLTSTPVTLHAGAQAAPSAPMVARK